MSKSIKRILITLAVSIGSFILSVVLMPFIERNEEGFIADICEKICLGLLLISIISFHLLLYFIIKAIGDRKNKKIDKEHVSPQHVVYSNPAPSLGESSQVTTRSNPMYEYNKPVIENKMMWPALAVLILFLPPVGIVYTLNKLIRENSMYYKNGKTLAFIGYVFLFFTLVPMIVLTVSWAVEGELTQALKALFALPLMALFLSLVMVIAGSLLKREGCFRDRLLYLITNEHVTRLDKLAEMMKAKKFKVYNTIDDFIRSGILPDAYIYPYDDEVIVPGISKKIAVRCASCSGTTVLYTNDERVCSYCGGRI